MIRRMRQADVPAAAVLAACAMKQPWSEAAFRTELENPQAYLLVCEEDASGTLTGYLSLQLTPDDAELTGIAVGEAYRRHGIAGQLLKTARAYLAERGIRRMVLEVRASNAPAIAFYETYGFTCIGVRRGFYEAPAEDALVMTDDKEQNDD